MINRGEHRETVMSIVIMGFVQYLRDKGVCFFLACAYECVCACVCMSTCMQSAIDLIGKVKAKYP